MKIFALIAVVVIGVLAWQARPIYRIYKGNKAEELVAQSLKAEQDGDFSLAFKRGGEAYKLAADNPNVLRRLARLSGETGADLGTAVYCLRRLRILDALTLEDRRLEVTVLMRLGKEDEALANAKEIVEEAPDDPAGYNALAMVYRRRGDEARALEMLNYSLELDPTNLENRLEFAADQTESPFSEIKSRGWATLWEISGDEGAQGLRALSFIDQKRRVPVGRELEFIRRLKEHPLGGESERVKALTWQIATDPLRRDAIIAEAIAARDGKPLSQIVPFLAWLNQMGEAEPLLEAIGVEDANSSAELFSLYINALSIQDRWDEVVAALEDDDCPLGEAQTQLSLVSIAAQRGADTDAVEDDLRVAMKLANAENSPGISFRVGRLAQARGFRDIAMEAYRYAAVHPQLVIPAQEQMFAMARQHGETGRMLAIIDEIERRGGAVPTFTREADYLKLLAGTEIELRAESGAKAAEDDPSDPERALVAALGRFRLYDLDGCRRFCEQVDDRLLPTGKRAVFAAMVAETGDWARGSSAVANISVSLLLPEEKELLAAAGLTIEK